MMKPTLAMMAVSFGFVASCASHDAPRDLAAPPSEASNHAASPTATRAVEPTLAMLQGRWRIASVTPAGRETPIGHVGDRIAVQDDRMTVPEHGTDGAGHPIESEAVLFLSHHPDAASDEIVIELRSDPLSSGPPGWSLHATVAREGNNLHLKTSGYKLTDVPTAPTRGDDIVLERAASH
jgi:hypothetical protein